MSALFRAARGVDFDRLYRRHAASVYRFAYAVLGNHSDAEDITQQTFLNAYRSIANGERPRKAENWLLTIAHNEVRRHFRDRQGKPFEVELDEELAQPAPERSDPSLADVLRALRHLAPAQRSALVMREFEGRSYAEIAEIMDVTESALEALLFRARRSLAEQLEEDLTCGEAEQALSRRLDRRLPRREARRLRAHLRECPTCSRLGDLQRRQRSVLKGLSILPVPASLFLFRGESAAAATGVGIGATAGGSAAAGAGATGLATGLVAKAAAVGAAAAVAGGVSYGVAAVPDAPAKAERKAAHAAAVAQVHTGGRAREVQASRARGVRPAPARTAAVRTRRAATRATVLPAHKAHRAKAKAAKAKKPKLKPTKSARQVVRVVSAPAQKPAKTHRVKTRVKTTKKTKRKKPLAATPRRIAPKVKTTRAKPPRPAKPERTPPASQKPKPATDPAAQAEARGRGQKSDQKK